MRGNMINIWAAALVLTGLFLPMGVDMAPAAAQEPTDPDMQVDSLRLMPGEALVFGFARGFTHQLLLIRLRGADAINAPLQENEVRAIFHSEDEGSRLEIENGTGETLYFDALADRSGRGGYSPVETLAVPAGQRIISGEWDFPIAALLIGEFSYGPHGGHMH